MIHNTDTVNNIGLIISNGYFDFHGYSYREGGNVPLYPQTHQILFDTFVAMDGLEILESLDKLS